ncbi:ATP-dependent zinc metalloprotease FtsH [Durusdinium trenchii]|uniref:ATP-dependent zinc metalloprotease FtsH n=1 Tax=Durusdinium trenchii TaxID=1381693 RepID=A0ABP0S9Q3_9DINO
MKRPAAQKQTLVKKPAAKPKKPSKRVPKEDLLLQILLISGQKLLQVKAPATWTTTKLKKVVTEELANSNRMESLQKLVHVGRDEPIPDGKSLEAVGLKDGSEIYAILHMPEYEDEEAEDSDWLDDDLFDLDFVRPARGDWDACHVCGRNRGCDYYGGECRRLRGIRATGQKEVTVQKSAEDESEFQQPYKDSLDYLNDQFSLLECEIRIAEHRRQSTKEDVGVEEPFLLRSRKINVFEHEAKRKLALARIHHRLKLTKEAGLEVPRLEVLLQKTKLDDFEKSVVVMLVGNTLSPKIQATLNVGERRFCVNAPLQVRVILETFCRDFKEEVQKRVYFYKSSRLASSGIIRIGAGARSGDLTGHTVHIDRRILDFVVGLDTVRTPQTPRPEINEVVEGSNLYKPSATLEQLVLPEDMKQGILALVDNFEQFCRYRKSSGLDDVIAHGSGLVLMFCGPSGTGKTLMVNALAAHLEKRVLLVNFKTLYSHNDTGLHEEDGSNVLKLFREAEMSDAVLFFDECESLFSQRGSGGSSELTALLTAMERYEGIIFLATNRPFDLDEAMYRRITSVFTFSKPDHVQRLEIWKLYTQTGVPLALDIDWEKIAMKFALTGGYIKNAIVSALLLAISRNNVDPKVTEEDITGGCIMQVRGSLQMQSFAKRLVPRAGLDSLVLAPNLKQKLLEIVAFEKARPLLLESWGFGDPGSLAQLGSGRREAEVIRVFPRQICL